MHIHKILIRLFENYCGEKLISFTQLPESGSSRKYFRLISKSQSIIGVYNPDKRENAAFIYITKHFHKHKLNIPKIFKTDLENGFYLLEDLGDITLFSLLNKDRNSNSSSLDMEIYYRRVIDQLLKFQIIGNKGLNYKYCYPRAAFDKQSIKWDLNYFKYYFAKLLNIQFDEQKLENDFNILTNYLLKSDSNYFMYRDFNSRNIMIRDNELYFIDYQGGRKGPLQYDIASLLYDSKANLSSSLRKKLLAYYIDTLSNLKKINRNNFNKYYYPIVLIRMLQMFGAYGYRGYYEGKVHFLKSIPYAVKNLESILPKIELKIPELKAILKKIISSELNKQFNIENSIPNKLTVRINSFSYRDKIPPDYTGNGGGFVFDCRAIPNPGRLEKYKQLTGKNKAVKDFLDSQPEAQKFLKESFDIVEQSIINYIGNKWTDLMVNYGCTGGQHRSVYCAEKLSEYLRKKYDIVVKLTHTKII